jgi:hypothetical protein
VRVGHRALHRIGRSCDNRNGQRRPSSEYLAARARPGRAGAKDRGRAWSYLTSDDST